MDVPAAAVFESTAAAVACVAWVTLLVVHWRATKADVKFGLWQFLHFAEDWAQGKVSGLSPMAARVEKELIEVRVKILMFFNRLCVHVFFVMIFLQLVEFLREPSLHAATWLLQSFAAYLPHVLIIAAPWLFSSSLLRPMQLFFFVLVLTTIFVSGSNSKDEIMGRLGFCLSAQVVQAFIFPVGAVTVVQFMSYAAAHTWVMGQAFGAVTLWLVLFLMCLNVLVSIALPIIFEFAVREWIVASFQSQDSDSLIEGFRQMLKGICDGELLLDGNFQICGRAPLLTCSKESYEECYDELAEMTLLVNASTTLMDIEEAHLRFVRTTDEPKVRMGMPTVKRFARPLDWVGIDAVLRRYARTVQEAEFGQQVPEEKQALPSMTMRVPGESRRHLRARHVSISSPFPRHHAAEDVFLFLHLVGFEGPPPPPTSRLGDLDEDQCPPSPPLTGQEEPGPGTDRRPRRRRRR
eukprot:s5971_g3.t1